MAEYALALVTAACADPHTTMRLRAERKWRHLPRLPAGRPLRGLGAQAGEEVRLGDRRAGGVGDADEVLVAERLLGDLRRDPAEPGLLDLARVRQQGVALAGHDRADVDVGRDARLGLGHLAAHLVGDLHLRHVDAQVAQGLPDLLPVAATHGRYVELVHRAG